MFRGFKDKVIIKLDPDHQHESEGGILIDTRGYTPEDGEVVWVHPKYDMKIGDRVRLKNLGGTVFWDTDAEGEVKYVSCKYDQVLFVYE